MSTPSSLIAPASGRSKPAITRSVVVLPEPDGPSIVKNSPARMSRSRLSIATTSPNARRTPRRRTASAGKRFVEDGKAFLELLVGCRERRQEADHVAVEPAREQDEAFLACRSGHGARGVAVLFDELEREHRAETPHLADDLVARRHVVEPCPQQSGDLLRALAEPGSRQLVEDGEARGARDRVPAERPAEPARAHCVHQLR